MDQHRGQVEEEFLQLYDKHKQGVYGYLMRLTGSRETTEELLQETFLKVYTSLESFRGESSFKTWVLIIARNTFLERVRKEGKHQTLELVDTIKVSQTTGTKKDHIGNLDLKLDIDQVLSKMTEKYRTVLVLREYHDLSYRQIGQVLGIPENNVKTMLFRARQKFRELYQNKGRGNG